MPIINTAMAITVTTAAVGMIIGASPLCNGRAFIVGAAVVGCWPDVKDDWLSISVLESCLNAVYCVVVQCCVVADDASLFTVVMPLSSAVGDVWLAEVSTSNQPMKTNIR